MIGVDQHGAELYAAWQLRSAEVLAALRALDGEQLRQPTRLPGWDRLTIVCHLR